MSHTSRVANSRAAGGAGLPILFLSSSEENTCSSTSSSALSPGQHQCSNTTGAPRAPWCPPLVGLGLTSGALTYRAHLAPHLLVSRCCTARSPSSSSGQCTKLRQATPSPHPNTYYDKTGFPSTRQVSSARLGHSSKVVSNHTLPHPLSTEKLEAHQPTRHRAALHSSRLLPDCESALRLYKAVVQDLDVVPHHQHYTNATQSPAYSPPSNVAPGAWTKTHNTHHRGMLSSSPRHSGDEARPSRVVQDQLKPCGCFAETTTPRHEGSPCEETEAAAYSTFSLATAPNSVLTSNAPSRVCNTTTTTTTMSTVGSSAVNGQSLYYKGPDPPPPLTRTRLYDAQGPVSFCTPPTEGGRHQRAELRTWYSRQDAVISQNSSKRKVHRGLWLSPLEPDVSFPVAIKFVEDRNARDGRSVKREIECHLFIQQRLHQMQKEAGCARLEDAWPSAELLGYYLDKKSPGRCILITRKLSGPDFFDVIRQEHNSTAHVNLAYEYHKLHWCTLALKRVQQYARLGIRHNDVKPDNIVLDFYVTPTGFRALDVKIIDLGTASMQSAKEFTGGTSWYESPEQKVLEYHSKKQRDPIAAKRVDIGLASDIWAAGLSITEVLVGRRIVDALKQPHGPGPLDYRGAAIGWAVPPEEWVARARRALLYAPREACKYTFCFDAAKYIFDRLVRPNPSERGTLQEATAKMKEQIEKALEHSRKAAAMTHAFLQPRLITPRAALTSHRLSTLPPSCTNTARLSPLASPQSHAYMYRQHHHPPCRRSNSTQSSRSS